jgi:hypothetical protein
MADRFQYRSEPVGGRDDRGAARRAASQSVESDPLAELARLIGQTEQGAGNRAAQAEPQYDHQQEYHEPAGAEPAPPSWMRTAAGGRQQPQAQPAALEPQGYSADPYPQEERPAPSFLRTMRQRDERQQPHYEQQQYEQHQYAEPQQQYEQHQYQPQQHPHGDQAQYDQGQHSQAQYDQSRYDNVLYDQNSQNAAHYQDQRYADGAYQGNYQEQDPNYPPYYGEAEQEEPRRKRGGLMTVAAVLALAVVGTAGAFTYRSFVGSPRSGEPPVIKAEPGATKIVPPTQTSDASGKIVDRIGGGQSGQEQLLSREEQPVDINGRNPPRVVFPPLNANANPPSPQSVATTTAVSSQQRPGAPNGALGDEPKRVRTLSIRPDQPDTTPSATAAQSAQSRTASARAQAPAPGTNTPMQLSPGGQPAPTRTASAQPVSGSGGYMVQISSQRSEADAQAAYRAMQSKFPSVLGSRTAMIRRADLGEKGIYYRAMVGPFSAAEDAGQLCNSLKSAGGQCVVQRN